MTLGEITQQLRIGLRAKAQIPTMAYKVLLVTPVIFIAKSPAVFLSHP